MEMLQVLRANNTWLIANKSKVLHGVPRDPIMATALTQLEEEEMENLPDDERPKVTSTHYHIINHFVAFSEKESKEGHWSTLWLVI